MKQSGKSLVAQGEIVKGTVIEVRPKEVLIDIGYKSEGVIPSNEFQDPGAIKVGDRLVFAPTGKTSTVKTIERWNSPSKDSALAGLNVFANYTHTRALQESGDTAGKEVPFYSRDTDTVGARYVLGAWAFNLSSTHQSSQFSDNTNAWAETVNGGAGLVPGYRLWNAQVGWKLPTATAIDVQLGVNNLADKRYYTRNVDGNAGRMVGAPRTTWVQARVAF
jgi:outer membrane receptor for Fe3+-dicitrate